MLEREITDSKWERERDAPTIEDNDVMVMNPVDVVVVVVFVLVV